MPMLQYAPIQILPFQDWNYLFYIYTVITADHFPLQTWLRYGAWKMKSWKSLKCQFVWYKLLLNVELPSSLRTQKNYSLVTNSAILSTTTEIKRYFTCICFLQNCSCAHSLSELVVLKESWSDSVNILGVTLPLSLKKKIQKNLSVKGISCFVRGLIFNEDTQS